MLDDRLPLVVLVFSEYRDRLFGSGPLGRGRAVRTHCCFCGQQCGIELLVKDNEVIGFEPWMEFPFNSGKLCPKGVKRYLQGAHPDRLLHALARDPASPAGFTPRPYDAAIGRVAAEIERIQRQCGAAAFGTPIDLGPYAQFRDGLLRHIAIEEKLLLPAAQAARDGAALLIASRLRLDHGAIAALLVPTPTPAIVATLRDSFQRHNTVEEGLNGLYATCDRLLEAGAAEIVARMQTYPAVRSSPHNDAPEVLPAVERALARAGYRLLAP